MWEGIQPVPFDVETDDSDENGEPKTRNLRTTFHSKVYRRRLHHAYHALLVWLAVALPLFLLDVAARSPDLMVEMLCEYIQVLYDRRQTVTLAAETVLSIQWRYRYLKRRLTGAWDLVASWRSERPLKMRIPIPLCIINALFRWSMMRGLSTRGPESRTWVTFAIGCKTAFWGLLRPCELSSLVRKNLKTPCDWPPSLSPFCCWCTPKMLRV